MTPTTPSVSTDAREALYAAYADVLKVNAKLDRSLVSFRGNKAEPFYRWFKYKEGFSSALVAYCVNELADTTGTLLDPFAGAGAALFASRELGWNAIGVEVLPVGTYAMAARLAAEGVTPESFGDMVTEVNGISFGDWYDAEYRFRHITITDGAFSEVTERNIASFRAFCDKKIRNANIRRLFEFACFAVLEEVSYTRKDGQYLRWDHRSPKARSASCFNKGPIAPFRRAIIRKLQTIADDLIQADTWGAASVAARRGSIDIRSGSCLDQLPQLPPGSVDFILTSPPYCNRYDYTRTYALELAFLGYGDEDVKQLRQSLLSCTVENREKEDYLRDLYDSLGCPERFATVHQVFHEQGALGEILEALDIHKAAGQLNNSNIPRMVRNYFYEMAFVLAECARVLRPGGVAVMVNDNVRYAGQEIPVDLILSDLASAFGLSTKHIWYLPRGKGNSSQQMGEHGRRELRKSICVWQQAG